MTNNNNLLMLIAVLLVGILGVMIVNNPPPSESPGDKISHGIDQIGEGISDAARDATDGKGNR